VPSVGVVENILIDRALEQFPFSASEIVVKSYGDEVAEFVDAGVICSLCFHFLFSLLAVIQCKYCI